MSLGLGIGGTVLNALAALWLLVAPFPKDLEAVGWGGGLPGVKKVLRQQRAVASVVVAGSVLQVLALLLK